ncbi:hypothetical protein [Abyssisolibacter fermentans]|nr:hypothetical protein [Abyssisolibacter fermentans]
MTLLITERELEKLTLRKRKSVLWDVADILKGTLNAVLHGLQQDGIN